MNNKIFTRLALLAAFTAALTACGDGEKQAAVTGETVASVNGAAITEAQLAAYAERRTGSSLEELDASVRGQIIDEMINIQLLAQKAKAEKLHEKSPLKEQLEFQRDTAMADAAMTGHLEANPVTEEDLKAEYEKRKSELGGTEYKAAHILVANEEEARNLIQQLNEGADFTELAKTHSTEPGASESGGDLGWFSANQMVAPFSNAVQAMQPGQISSEPVQTQFGWHVIRLEDVREVPPPAFEDLQQQLRRVLMNQRVQEFINGLRENAKIEKKEAAPAETTPPETAENQESE